MGEPKLAIRQSDARSLRGGGCCLGRPRCTNCRWLLRHRARPYRAPRRARKRQASGKTGKRCVISPSITSWICPSSVRILDRESPFPLYRGFPCCITAELAGKREEERADLLPHVRIFLNRRTR